MQGPIQDIRKFILAGNAIFTIKSRKTGQRFTYKIVRKDSADLWQVRLLNGPDNSRDYTYIGFIGRLGGEFFPRKKKGGGYVSAPSVKAISWFLQNANSPMVEVWHEGRCGRCGRRLTVPESVLIGWGPECLRYIG